MTRKDINKAINSGKIVRISEKSDMYNKFTRGRLITRVNEGIMTSEGVVPVTFEAEPPYEINVLMKDIEIIDLIGSTFKVTKLHNPPRLYSSREYEQKKVADSVMERNADLLTLFNSFGYKVTMEDKIGTNGHFMRFWLIKGDSKCEIPVSMRGDNYFIVQDDEYDHIIKSQISYNKDLKSSKYVGKLSNIFNNILASDINKRNEKEHSDAVRAIQEIHTGNPNISIIMRGEGTKHINVRIMDKTRNTGLSSQEEIIKFRISNTEVFSHVIFTRVNETLAEIHKNTSVLTIADDIMKRAAAYREIDFKTWVDIRESVKLALRAAGLCEERKDK